MHGDSIYVLLSIFVLRIQLHEQQFLFDGSSTIINNLEALKFHRYPLRSKCFICCLLLSKQLINWETESLLSWVIVVYRVETLGCIIALEETVVRSLEWMWEKQEVKCSKELYPHILVLVTTKTINKTIRIWLNNNKTQTDFLATNMLCRFTSSSININTINSNIMF